MASNQLSEFSKCILKRSFRVEKSKLVANPDFRPIAPLDAKALQADIHANFNVLVYASNLCYYSIAIVLYFNLVFSRKQLYSQSLFFTFLFLSYNSYLYI